MKVQKTTVKIDANAEIIILNASLVSNLAFQYATVKSYLEDYTILPSENEGEYKGKMYGNRKRIIRPQYDGSPEIQEAVCLYCFIEDLYDALS